MHTNPILICFCSILYYRDLAVHIERYKIEKKIIMAMNKTKTISDEDIYFFLKKFGGRFAKYQETVGETPADSAQIELSSKKHYKKYIVNKWHVMLRLTLNQELIQYRRHNIRKKDVKESVSIFTKIKAICNKKKD